MFNLVPRVRRRAVAVVGAFMVLLLVAACGADTEPAAGNAPSADGAFPVTITHSHGTTEIPKRPQRVIALGFSDVDPLLALGVVPIAMRPWADMPGPGSWAKDRLHGAQPVQLPSQGDVDLEKIAELQPDLIVAINAAVDDALYNRLSSVAPTIVRPAGFADFATPWQDATRMIGAAVGKPQEADQLIATTQARLDEVAAKHPQFAQATGAVLLLNPRGGYWVYGRNDARGQFLTALGIKLPPGLQSLDDGKKFYLDIGAEQTTLLDSGVLVVIDQGGDTQRLATDPLFQRLDVAKRGDVITVPSVETGIAMAHNTVLSIPYTLDTVAPLLAEKLG
ncbi:iron-siderophore ABC transporter substrate-binding protein [Saccharopolyspora sp. K220]|uniref:iron-siderophore ABC transporter substrate-binding protein n=1 Tax=Saccharopolyspora soli TaxID=2926618 RepID=UPI001F588E6E|nr:iron-siderophore ABC transporter substrate-binding protein [Saccharopolyspora soli]MCI2422794.1 iron-siderophore ABC transporter substrate-binding protein [Saccharopolyspora soli]